MRFRPAVFRSGPNLFRRSCRTIPFSSLVALMSSSAENNAAYVPPEVWKYESSAGSKMTMNRPTAGSRFEKELPVGRHPIQLYSIGSPNGQKVTILLEELLAAGHSNCEYDAWIIKIFESDQFGSGFVDLNPNSKIPAMRIKNEDGNKPLDLFESGSMMLHLAEKCKAFIPDDTEKRAATLNWLFWQIGSAPYLGGGFGHFYTYADEKQKYPIDRFTMETKRQLHVLDIHLKTNKYMVGDVYTIADMAIFPWYGRVVQGEVYPNADIFLNVKEEYPNVIHWANELSERPAVQRGLRVNSPWMEPDGIEERHAASDLDV